MGKQKILPVHENYHHLLFITYPIITPAKLAKTPLYEQTPRTHLLTSGFSEQFRTGNLWMFVKTRMNSPHPPYHWGK
jgi:hypothetical protein